MSDDRNVLLFDDFSDLPVGVIAGDYSPAGEYHVVSELADSGRWREVVLHHSYKRISRGNWQVVLETDGCHVLEQTIVPGKWEPTLVTGWPYDWPSATVEAGVRPLTRSGWRAIVFRYRHARRFYAASFEDGKVRVIRRDLDQDSVLAEAECELDCDAYTMIRIECRNHGIAVSAKGKLLLECEDNGEEAFLEGGVGFAATDVTRFRDLTVSASPEAEQDHKEKRNAAEQALFTARSRYPKAVLWKKIPTPQWGSDRNLRVGDINGDGQNEIVMARRTERLGGDNACSITSLAAYNLNGEMLWTYGEPGSNNHHTTADLCYQIHDLDGDGKAEIHFARDFEFFRADGATGKVERLMSLPEIPPDEKWPRGLYKALGDSLYFCDLTGSGRPDSMILKDRYKNAWAYDKNLKQLWHFKGNLGHYPFAKDINGDGKDEVAFGYHLLDHTGKEMWAVSYAEHADNIVLVDLHDSGDASGPAFARVIIAGSDAGFYILDLEANIRVHHPIGHAQSMCIGNLLPERDGLEIMCNTFWGPAGITVLLDEAGRLLHEYEPMPYACLLQPVNWVPASEGNQPGDLVLLSTHPRQGGLINGKGERLVMFPDDGHPVLCSDARDIDGDGIDEVLTWNHDEIWIYKADAVAGRTQENYPQRNPWYNDSNYRAQLSLPGK